MEIHQGHCFYCGGRIADKTAHVDHFPDWSRYPNDLGHTLVLADDRCNSKRRYRFPGSAVIPAAEITTVLAEQRRTSYRA
jgi:hypothetical protein